MNQAVVVNQLRLVVGFVEIDDRLIDSNKLTTTTSSHHDKPYSRIDANMRCTTWSKAQLGTYTCIYLNLYIDRFRYIYSRVFDPGFALYGGSLGHEHVSLDGTTTKIYIYI